MIAFFRRLHLKPKILTTLSQYTASQFSGDITAGVIVGIVALPLAIAFAIASGVSPEKGLITAVIGGFIISLLGGSRVQIGGPTGAFVVIIYAIVQQYGVSGLMTATIIAGVLLILMGLAGLGSAIKFIPYPVIIGFTSGIALIIFTSQIKDVFGLPIVTLPAEFMEKWAVYIHHVAEINYYALGISGGSIVLALIWQRWIYKIPGSLIVLMVFTAIVAVFDIPVETIGSRFGVISATLPPPTLPQFDLATIRLLLPAGLTIAMLGGIEALLSAVVADGMMGGRHRSNMELVAQGIANIGSALWGGIPVTGAIARTATNIKNGAKTPIAGIIHALVLLIVMLIGSQWVTYIPMPALAAILVMVAYNMSEWRSFRAMLRGPRSDVIVLFTTFVLTVWIDLTVAIQVGIVLSAFLFIRRMATVTNVGIITREFYDEEENEQVRIDSQQLPEGVEIYDINGPFFFGAAYKFKESVNILHNQTKVRIIHLQNVPAIDATGIHTLEEVYQTSKHQGIQLLLAGVHRQPLVALEQSGLFNTIGQKNIFDNLHSAIERARQII